MKIFKTITFSESSSGKSNIIMKVDAPPEDSNIETTEGNSFVLNMNSFKTFS